MGREYEIGSPRDLSGPYERYLSRHYSIIRPRGPFLARVLRLGQCRPVHGALCLPTQRLLDPLMNTT